MRVLTNFSLVLSVILVGGMQASAADDPKALASSLETAIREKSLDAAEKLVSWGQAPVAAYRLFEMSLADCFEPATCKVELGPIGDEEKNPQGYFFPIAPEGTLKLRVAGEGEGEAFSMPYAKVNGSYRIIIGQATDEDRALSKQAADARKIAETMDPDLLSGEALPADGGEPFAALKEYAAAVAKGDKKFLAEKGTPGDRYFFGKAYTDNPVKSDIAIKLAQMENVTSPALEQGFVKNDRAILLIKGETGQGWPSAGAVTMAREGGKWSIEDKSILSYPPEPN